MRKLEFTVDAALLRELGERLVGQPHIALAELIKNSYDADATQVVLTFSDDAIVVSDDGHGMDDMSFERFWMRIGSPHKSEAEKSPVFHRPLTGSKGVGRLSAQFLADRLVLTTSAGGPASPLRAKVDWTEALEAKELTSAVAYVDHVSSQRFAGGSAQGTELRLEGLRQEWNDDAFELLARELWPLQPPFGSDGADLSSFEVDLQTPNVAASKRFETQMSAVLRLWEARITASISAVAEASPLGLEEGAPPTSQTGPPICSGSGRRRVNVVLRFDDGVQEPLDLDLELGHLSQLEFEIRVFRLTNRQKFGIAVDEARDYFRRFGGVHIYDAGFHLPYYGPDADWLGIEQDHAHRISRSSLLPKEFNVERGLNYLPTNSRIYGVVRVDTGEEARQATKEGRPISDSLTIGIGRDRLIDNPAYRELVRVVRTAMDFYAVKTAERAVAPIDSHPPGELLSAGAVSLGAVVDEVAHELSPTSEARLRTAISTVGAAATSEARKVADQAGLLGALASAGIAAVAYEHEAARQFRELARLGRRLKPLGADGERLAAELEDWLGRARGTRALFSPLLDIENREVVRSLRARGVLAQVVEQTQPVAKRLAIGIDQVPEDLMLPPGTFAEWSAIWQNIVINASNASLGQSDPVLEFVASSRGKRTTILALDNGVGVDLESAAGFFDPFKRGLEITSTRGLGTGGTGLGLTIVRMIATKLHSNVEFVEPPPGWATAFKLSWEER